jgi:hypothetical protein
MFPLDSGSPFQSQIEREIESLLAKAEKQVKAEKYTYPRGENAYVTIHEVLRIDPGNGEAEMMLEKIRDEYMKLGESAFRKGDYKKAKRHFGRSGRGTTRRQRDTLGRHSMSTPALPLLRTGCQR